MNTVFQLDAYSKDAGRLHTGEVHMLTEVAVEAKPRVIYADFRKTLADGSLAWLIQRVIADVAANSRMRQLSPRFLYHLDLLKRSSLGSKPVMGITDQDLTGYLKDRARTVGKATCKHDLRTLTYVFKHAKATWPEWREIPIKAIEDATPYLLKNGIIGTGNLRERRCSPEERAALVDYFQHENARGRNEIKAMPDIIDFALVSARRRGEICSLARADVDPVKQIYWQRNMKHPTKKGVSKSFVLFPDIAEIINRQPVAANDDRVFPYSGNVIGQKFVYAKHQLEATVPGISTLHFHDLRATAISNWLLRGLTVEEVRVAVSGHDTTLILERVYDRRDATDYTTKAKFRALLDAANDAPAPMAKAA